MKRFIFIILSAILLVLTVGCSQKKETKPIENYEQPALTMVRCIRSGDDESYLNCFTDGARESYKNSESCDPELTSSLLPKRGKNPVLGCKTLSARELDKEEVTALEEDYKARYSRRISVYKAYELSVSIGTEIDGEEVEDLRDITVIYTDNGWLIYGDVITSFDF